ncbi:GntR family transcriptional regulator [Actinoplanes italicus]|uniref:DNA-binding transcriptional MocR family regulator n=1 Tax=Actinoplanes italicus TaxID=113567 RepID=A0A2T0K1X3_9ACTN|nr:PLP-dependent aminotransferase family protein [Actinoplanes italicus]PRX16802.1 DNA-binding transcriptional MocR family regulator [Actinoplanes italicus]GIE31065.1 GntR family transcriptional regulator [Actinoplanes italicus]
MSPITSAELAARLGRWSAGRGPLYLLLAGRLRALIDDGELPPGTGLPTDRALAAGLATGRTTVVAAYDLLREEGRLLRRQGSGTWVAGSAPAAVPSAEPTGNPVFLHLLEQPDHVSQFACAGPLSAPPECRDAFRAALTRLDDGLGYFPAGHPRLRQAIAQRYASRGLSTEAGQILVTTGGQQALSLLTRALVAPGDEVAVQAPTYPGMLEVLREHAAVPLPVGDDFASAFARAPVFAYHIGVCHNPTGRTLPETSRREIAEAARAAGVPLVVDDVLAELDFGGPQPLLPGTISVGSLSKVVWGGLRVGWIRADPILIGRLARLKAVHDLGSAVIDQLAATYLLADLDALAAARVLQLRERHDHLCAELREHLPDWTFDPADGGQTLWVRLPRGDAGSFAQAALRHGVAVLPGNQLDASGGSTDRVRLPFVAPPAELTAAVSALADAWHGYAGGPAVTPLPAIAV